MASRTVEVKILGDERDLSRAFRAASKDASGFGTKAGHAFAGVAKAAAGAGLALGAGLAATVGVGVKSLLEHEKANAQLTSRLKSTGNAANTSVDAIDSLADAIEKKSGIDDVAIKSGAALLLSFTNVRNEAGKGNDVFNRTVELTADLSAALGIDATNAAKMLGKALDDPTKAAGALRKAGVTLTDAQKAQIKAMVEAGDVMGAQKLVLGELEKRYGTAAEAAGSTLGGRLEILKARLEEVAEKVAARVLPLFERLVAWVTDHWPQIEAVISTVFDAIAGVVQSVLVPAFHAVQTAAAWLVGKVREHWQQIRSAVQTVLDVVKGAITTFVGVVQGIWARWGDEILAVARRVFGFVRTTIENAMAVIRGIVQTVSALIHGDWSKAWDGIKQVVSGILAQIKNLIVTAWDGFRAVAETLGRKVWEGIKDGTSALVGLIGRVLGGARDAIVNFAGDMFSAAKGLGSKIIDGIGNGLSALGSKLAGWIKAPINAVLSAWNSIGIPGFKIHIPLPGPVPDIDFGVPGIGLPDIPLLASGTDFHRGGLAVVGERGPELVELPRGARVFPNGTGPGGQTVNVTQNIYADPSIGRSPAALMRAAAWNLRTAA